ncbi:MAG: hypothetical protein ACYTAO_02300 [Planctomycetota bacterium]
MKSLTHREKLRIKPPNAEFRFLSSRAERSEVERSGNAALIYCRSQIPPLRPERHWDSGRNDRAKGGRMTATTAVGMRKSYEGTPDLSRLVFLACLCVLLLMPASASVRAAEKWHAFAVSPGTDDQERPDIHNDIIVWQQFVAEYGDYDVYVADLNSPGDALFLVIGDANDQMNPAVYENTVVWQDLVTWGGSGDWDVRMADVSDRAEAQVFIVSDIVNNDEQNPAIDGNIVVWQDGAEGDFNIYGADITDPANPAEFLIAAFDFDQQRPAVHRTTVVWQDNYFGDADILAGDIWQRNKPTDFGVSLVEKDQQSPAISGTHVVWQDNFFGDFDIYAADISVPEAAVQFPIAARESTQMNPDIDGNIVVWQSWGLLTEDDRDGNWDIFGYNLTTRREFQITADPHDQAHPAISGNIVVWQDNRDGNWQIYAVLLDGPEVAQCVSRPAGDINGDCTIDFADYTLMASNWLECGLEPQEACPSR